MTALVLAQAPPSVETVGPGLAGFLAIFAVALATVLLLRSMVGHLRKVRYSPDPAAQDRHDRQHGQDGQDGQDGQGPHLGQDRQQGQDRHGRPGAGGPAGDTREDAPGRDA